MLIIYNYYPIYAPLTPPHMPVILIQQAYKYRPSSAMNQTKKRIISLITAITLVYPWFASLFPTRADNLTRTYIRTDRMTASTTTGGTVCARWATTTGTDTFIEVTFPAGYTVNSTPGNWTVTTSNLPAGSSPMPGIAVPGAGGVSGQIVRWPIGDVSSAATLYCFNFSGTSTLTTGTTGNDKQASIRTYTAGTVAVGSGSVLDNSNVALAVITNDQVVITATVPPTFSFALGTNTQPLGTLSTSSIISGTGVTVTLGTNAANGWLTWVKSANAALNSTFDTIPTLNAGGNETLTIGTKGYVLDSNITTDSSTVPTGDVAIPAEFNDTDDTGTIITNRGGTLSTIFQEVATANGPTDGDVITLIPRVTISALTKAATDYTDTLTIVGAANFQPSIAWQSAEVVRLSIWLNKPKQ